MTITLNKIVIGQTGVTFDTSQGPLSYINCESDASALAEGSESDAKAVARRWAEVTCRELDRDIAAAREALDRLLERRKYLYNHAGVLIRREP